MDQAKRDKKRLNRKSKQERGVSTKAREVLAKMLKHHISGYKFQAQAPVFGEVVEFYCAQLQLAIFIDGSGLENAKVKKLKKEGVKVLRYSSDEIIQFPEMVDIDIVKTIETFK